MRHPISRLTAGMISPLNLSYMCKNAASILKYSLALEPLVFSPYRCHWDRTVALFNQSIDEDLAFLQEIWMLL